MSRRLSTWLTTLTTAAILYAASAQDQLRGVLTMALGDIAKIKEKAVAGDPDAQRRLADAFKANFHASEALAWYRKSAVQGTVEAQYQLGNMLLFGAPGIPVNLTVQPNPSEGIQWTFMAATNFHPNACWNMGRAMECGLGVNTNLMEAYAWLKLLSEIPGGLAFAKYQINELALRLDPLTLKQGDNLAARFKEGHWRVPVVLAIAENDPRLQLQGITGSGKSALAIISGKTLAEGESAKIASKPDSLNIKCLTIGNDFVVIAVDGEAQPRRLHLK